MSQAKAYKPVHGGYPDAVRIGASGKPAQREPQVGDRVRVVRRDGATHFFPTGTEGVVAALSADWGTMVEARVVPTWADRNAPVRTFVQDLERADFELLD